MAKEVPEPADTMDMEQQTDESCFENNGYLSIIKIVEKEVIKEIVTNVNVPPDPLRELKPSYRPSREHHSEELMIYNVSLGGFQKSR